GSRGLSDDWLLAMGFTAEGQWLTPAGVWIVDPDDRPDPTVDLKDTVALLPSGWAYLLGHTPGPCALLADSYHQLGDDIHDIGFRAATLPLALSGAILVAVFPVGS
ncbi:hypothetical protein LCGC14_2249690, partial [marine sediment metagenome]